MNAISPPPTIPTQTDVAMLTARHVRICQELQDLGLALVRAVTRTTLTDLAAFAPDAKLPAAQSDKAADRSQLVGRLANTIRQLLVMEARLLGIEPSRRAAPGRKLADMRRDMIRRAIDLATAKSRDRVKLRRAAAAKLDEYLANDKQAEIPAATLMDKVATALGITIDFARLPDTMREAFGRA